MFTHYKPIVQSTVYFLKLLKVKVCSNTVNETLQNHPDYPSLLSINDSLQQWHIDTAVLETIPEKLQELPTPFIAVLNNNSFAVVEKNNDAITYTTDNKYTPVTKTKEDFIKEWKGIVLLAEATEQAGEANYKKAMQRQILQTTKLPLVVLILAVVVLLVAYKSHWNIGFTAFAIIKLLGIVVTSLLLWYEIDKTNPLLQQICSAAKTTNCNAILSGKQAKLFNTISWSEIGFIYFASGFVFLLLSFANGSMLPALSFMAWLNVLALPYTIFSVYYQWRVAKQWCVLCLAVQALLISEFAITLFTINFLNSLHFPFFFFFLFDALLPTTAWFLLKPFLQQAQQQKRTKRELARLKYDTRIFNALLPKQKQITANPQGLGITIGNPNAENTIIKVCNPYCNPCANAHPKIEALLKSNPNIKVQIIFTATNNEGDIRALPVKHLLAINAQNNMALTEKALNDWYKANKKDYEAFATKYPINGELKQQEEKITAMSNWCNTTEIRATPTYFINGCQLPDIYSINDLKYLLA